jgi:hypothetical protein
MILTWINRSTCPSSTLFTTNPTWMRLRSNPGLCGRSLTTTRLSQEPCSVLSFFQSLIIIVSSYVRATINVGLLFFAHAVSDFCFPVCITYLHSTGISLHIIPVQLPDSFAKFWTPTITFFRSVHPPPVRLSTWNNSTPTARIMRNITVCELLLTPTGKIQGGLKSNKITGTLQFTGRRTYVYDISYLRHRGYLRQ